MATPPTFEAEYETAWSTVAAGAKTASVTVGVGDVLVVCGITESNTYTLATPTGGGLTYTLQQSVVTADYTACYVWTAVSASSQTYTLSVSMSGGTGYWGFNCLRFSGSDGVGASSKTNVASGAPSLALTTGTDNSTIVVANGDWNAADGASRTWRTVNGITPTSGNGLENTYARDSSRATFYVARWNDAGAAGSKTTGLSAPSGQKYSIIAVEVKGTAGGTDATATPAVVAAVAALPRPDVNVSAGPAAAAAVAALPRPAVNVAAAPAAVTAVAALPRPDVNVTVGASVVSAVVSLPTPTVLAGGNVTATPAAVAVVATVPRPGVNVAAGPAVVPVTVTAPQPALNVSAGPTVIATTVALARPNINVAAGPAAIAAAATVPGVAVNVTVGATVIPCVVALPTPSVGGTTAATPPAVTVTLAVPRAAVNVGAGPGVIPVVVTVPMPTIPGTRVKGTSDAAVAAAVASVAAVSALRTSGTTVTGSGSTSTVG
jgi:hypothetical protein